MGGVYFAEGKGYKIEHLSRIPNLASEIGALGAFTEAALLGATLRKAPKTSIYSNIAT